MIGMTSVPRLFLFECSFLSPVGMRNFPFEAKLLDMRYAVLYIEIVYIPIVFWFVAPCQTS